MRLLALQSPAVAESCQTPRQGLRLANVVGTQALFQFSATGFTGILLDFVRANSVFKNKILDFKAFILICSICWTKAGLL